MLIYQDVSDKTLKKLIIEMEEKNLKRLFNLFYANVCAKHFALLLRKKYKLTQRKLLLQDKCCGSLKTVGSTNLDETIN